MPLLCAPQPNLFVALACLQALGTIGTPEALAAVEGYARDERLPVRRALHLAAIWSSWDRNGVSFDRNEYAERVLREFARDRTSLSLDGLALDAPFSLSWLTASSKLRELRIRDIWRIDRDSSEWLALSKLTSLESLDLSGTHVTDAWLTALGGLASLQSLTLWSTGVTDAGLEVRPRTGHLERWSSQPG